MSLQISAPAGSSGGTGSASTPKVDMTWTGTGDVFSERSSGTFTDEYGTSSYRYTFSGRNATIGVDTGCAKGGRLTALRYPELELVSVPAERRYAGAEEARSEPRDDMVAA